MDHQKVQRAFSADDDDDDDDIPPPACDSRPHPGMLTLLRDVSVAPGASRCG